MMEKQNQSQSELDLKEREPADLVEPRALIELVLLCYARRVDDVIAGLTKKAQQTVGLLPAEVYWDGRTRKRWLGVIILTAEGSIPPTFLEKLDRDPQILDYFVAPRECSRDKQKKDD
jgi:hypothetical protein